MTENIPVITTGRIKENIWQISEGDGAGHSVDAYLVCGKTGAAVIDALEKYEDLYDRVRELTDLPLVLLLTHGHIDHAGKSVRKFFENDIPVYLGEKDIVLLPEYSSGYPYLLLADGMTFDLGGIVLEACSLAGHTPDSYVFLERKKQWLFSGDSIGSGHFWMQLPDSLPMDRYTEILADFDRKTGTYEDLLVWPGHRYQSPVQLNRQYIRDVLDVCREVSEGRRNDERKVMKLRNRDIVFCEASGGMLLNMCYDPDRIKSA